MDATRKAPSTQTEHSVAQRARSPRYRRRSWGFRWCCSGLLLAILSANKLLDSRSHRKRWMLRGPVDEPVDGCAIGGDRVGNVVDAALETHARHLVAEGRPVVRFNTLHARSGLPPWRKPSSGCALAGTLSSRMSPFFFTRPMR